MKPGTFSSRRPSSRKREVAARGNFWTRSKESDEFVKLFEGRVATKEGNQIPVFDGALTESSFKEQRKTRNIACTNSGRETPPSVACRVSFWGRLPWNMSGRER